MISKIYKNTRTNRRMRNHTLLQIHFVAIYLNICFK